jgi:hypothetical protein
MKGILQQSWAISAPSLVSGIRLLLLDPLVNINALKTPLSAHLERGQLALLGHGVHGLLSDLKQLGDLWQR